MTSIYSIYMLLSSSYQTRELQVKFAKTHFLLYLCNGCEAAQGSTRLMSAPNYLSAGMVHTGWKVRCCALLRFMFSKFRNSILFVELILRRWIVYVSTTSPNYHPLLNY